jgi:transposase-like protein
MARHHSDEIKSAVMAALLAGQGVNEVAKQYNVPKQTVSYLKAKLDEKLGQSGLKREIGTLVMELLETKLETLKAIALAISKPDYLQKQSASEVAVLYGVLADKSFRILTAMANSEGHHETR